MPNTPLNPTTELEAVNTMLSVIGEEPVNQLDGVALVSDVALARDVLREISVDVQSKGWHFNTEKDYPLAPTSTGEIKVPRNVARLKLNQRHRWAHDVTVRGERLYDRTEHTYTFDETLLAEVVVMLTFDMLPQAARRYITIKAARTFADRALGSQQVAAFTREDEDFAMMDLKEFEGDQEGANIFNHGMVAEMWLR